MENIKKLTFGAVVSLMVALLFMPGQSSAACYGRLFVGDVIYGCDNTEEDNTPILGGEPVDGIAVNIKARKITLNNYDGGPIGITAPTEASFGDGSFEIELIGENTITAGTLPEGDSDYMLNAGLINITPTFTGTGTLKIVAAEPFFSENPETFTTKVVGADYRSSRLGEKVQGELAIEAPICLEDDSDRKPTIVVACLSTLAVVLLSIIIVQSSKLKRVRKENQTTTQEGESWNQPQKNQ